MCQHCHQRKMTDSQWSSNTHGLLRMAAWLQKLFRHLYLWFKVAYKLFYKSASCSCDKALCKMQRWATVGRVWQATGTVSYGLRRAAPDAAVMKCGKRVCGVGLDIAFIRVSILFIRIWIPIYLLVSALSCRPLWWRSPQWLFSRRLSSSSPCWICELRVDCPRWCSISCCPSRCFCGSLRLGPRKSWE